jgi:hypothetical protein
MKPSHLPRNFRAKAVYNPKNSYFSYFAGLKNETILSANRIFGQTPINPTLRSLERKRYNFWLPFVNLSQILGAAISLFPMMNNKLRMTFFKNNTG